MSKYTGTQPANPAVMNPRLRNGLLAGAIALVVYLVITMVFLR